MVVMFGSIGGHHSAPLEGLGYIMERIFFEFSEFGHVPQKETCPESFCRYKILIFSGLQEFPSGGISIATSALWKPDCDCFRESLRATMGLCGGSLPIRETKS
jgi:hypothetical protein